MVTTNLEVFILTNRSNHIIEIWIEPEAECVKLDPDKKARIEMTKVYHYSDPLEIDLEKGIITIYEPRQYDLKIYIDNELRYFTTPNRPRI